MDSPTESNTKKGEMGGSRLTVTVVAQNHGQINGAIAFRSPLTHLMDVLIGESHDGQPQQVIGVFVELRRQTGRQGVDCTGEGREKLKQNHVRVHNTCSV